MLENQSKIPSLRSSQHFVVGLGQAKVVKDFPDDGVLAADLSFPSGFWLVPPRQVGSAGMARITMDDVNSFDQSMI